MATEKQKTKKTQATQTTERGFDIRGFWVRLWELLMPVHKLIKKVLFVMLFVELTRLVGPYILKMVIDLITNFSVEKIPQIVGLVFGMFLVNETVSVLQYTNDKRIFKILAQAESDLAGNAHRKLIYLGLGYHEKENTGSKISKIQRGVDKIIELLSNLSWEVAPTIFQIIFTAVVLFWVDWRFGLVIVFFVPAFVMLTISVNRRVFPLRKNRFDIYEKSAGMMIQSIININTVKSFTQEKRECLNFGKLREKLKTTILQEYGNILKQNLKRNLVIDSGRLLILLFGAFLVWKGEITVGTLVFVFTISEKALISLFRISRLYDRIMESSEAVERIYALSKEETDIKNPRGGLTPKNIEGKIEFKDVSFAYAESKLYALKKINLRIPSGATTALVGPSGGGKTTLARMVYRHYDPTEGAVLLDGKDLRDYDLYGFRKFFAIVPQDVEIFNASVSENIAYANPDASQSEIKAAARIANAEEFISQLSDGYETIVGERGIKLSGGQRQRIGIARAILANPKVLIFDEATSNLDSQSERLIQDAMDKICKNRTVIIIAHRLSTIRKADKIVVLEKGKVVETGSHTELSLVNDGLYKKLIDLQRMGDVG
ncbi:MAG: ABC transporter ATP-binding protein [Candidatus Moranbacteria bacterium]|nr:ABC transporter ATP-binding protein [Candidatus Moranbacteria bacterium]